MSSLTVIQSKITKTEMLPTNMRSIDGLSLKEAFDLLDSDLFSSDVSYLYGGAEYVREIKKFDAVTMFGDMKHFMYAYEGDMVVFYSKEIKLKFGGDDLVMDYLQYLQIDYIKMALKRICDDTLGLTSKGGGSGADQLSKKYTDYEISLLKRFIDEGSHSHVLWKDSISSPRVLPPKGFVYIVEDAKDRLVKIGRSENPEQRVNTIRTSSGRVVKRVFITDCFYGYRKAEGLVHKELADTRRVGEWFSCDFETAKEVVDSVVGSLKQPDDLEIGISELIKRYNFDLALHQMTSFVASTGNEVMQ